MVTAAADINMTFPCPARRPQRKTLSPAVPFRYHRPKGLRVTCVERNAQLVGVVRRKTKTINVLCSGARFPPGRTLRVSFVLRTCSALNVTQGPYRVCTIRSRMGEEGRVLSPLQKIIQY